MNREQEKAMFARKRPAPFQKFDKVMIDRGDKYQSGSFTIPKELSHKVPRVLRNSYTDSEGRLHQLSSRIPTYEEIKNKKYDPHDYNRILDKERLGSVKPIGIPKVGKDLRLIRHTEQQMKDYNLIYPIKIEGRSGGGSFRTKDGLMKWLKDRGLTVVAGGKIIGSYKEIAMQGNAKSFEDWANKKRLKRTKILSNGDYTEAFIEEGRNGNTIYYLNPNYARKILPYEWD